MSFEKVQDLARPLEKKSGDLARTLPAPIHVRRRICVHVRRRICETLRARDLPPYM